MAAKIAHIALAFLLFFGATGVGIDRHFCRDELKSIAFFQQAKSCHVAACKFHSPSENRNCCHNQAEFHKLDTDQQVAPGMDLPNAPDEVTEVLIPALPVVIAAQVILSSYLTFKPPIVCTDRLVLLQIFLC